MIKRIVGLLGFKAKIDENRKFVILGISYVTHTHTFLLFILGELAKDGPVNVRKKMYNVLNGV